MRRSQIIPFQLQEVIIVSSIEKTFVKYKKLYAQSSSIGRNLEFNKQKETNKQTKVMKVESNLQ